MYAIYNNVEDPDGFYGVKTHDVESALLLGLDHEGDHWNLFGVHGAMIESSTSSRLTASSMLSAVRNLHSLGFSHTASAIMKNVRSGRDVHSSNDPFILDLAWRTGDWDLPLSSEAAQTSQGLLYTALRTVHRERDPEIARSFVFQALGAEVEHLHDLGMERMTQIKQITANLLCLREIAHWLSPPVQHALTNGECQGDVLRRFTEIRPGLE